jgi:hypothetical protein
VFIDSCKLHGSHSSAALSLLRDFTGLIPPSMPDRFRLADHPATIAKRHFNKWRVIGPREGRSLTIYLVQAPATKELLTCLGQVPRSRGGDGFDD